MISVRLSAVRQAKWYESLTRFLLGGAATVMTGVIADKTGPEYGGLFLAFPAIFCASATLIEKHERERKERIGLHGAKRGRSAAALDAAGAALGAFGLISFGAAIWFFAPRLNFFSLLIALVAWIGVALVCWLLRQRSELPRRWRTVSGRPRPH